MDDLDKLYEKFREQGLVRKYGKKDNEFDVASKIETRFNNYTKKEAVEAALKWILRGQR